MRDQVFPNLLRGGSSRWLEYFPCLDYLSWGVPALNFNCSGEDDPDSDSVLATTFDNVEMMVVCS